MATNLLLPAGSSLFPGTRFAFFEPQQISTASQTLRAAVKQLLELLLTQCRYFHPQDLLLLRNLSAQLQLTFPKCLELATRTQQGYGRFGFPLKSQRGGI
jgi:hypothetical protein